MWVLTKRCRRVGSIRGAARTRPTTPLIAVRKSRGLNLVLSRRTPSKFHSHHLLRAHPLYRLQRRQQLLPQHPQPLLRRRRYLHPFTPRCKSLPSASGSGYRLVSPSLSASFCSCENIAERGVQLTMKRSLARELGIRPPDQWRCLMIA